MIFTNLLYIYCPTYTVKTNPVRPGVAGISPPQGFGPPGASSLGISPPP